MFGLHDHALEALKFLPSGCYPSRGAAWAGQKSTVLERATAITAEAYAEMIVLFVVAPKARGTERPVVC